MYLVQRLVIDHSSHTPGYCYFFSFTHRDNYRMGLIVSSQDVIDKGGRVAWLETHPQRRRLLVNRLNRTLKLFGEFSGGQCRRVCNERYIVEKGPRSTGVEWLPRGEHEKSPNRIAASYVPCTPRDCSTITRGHGRVLATIRGIFSWSSHFRLRRLVQLESHPHGYHDGKVR